MNRITQHDLESVIKALNEDVIGNGDYDLDWAYGGVRVVQSNGSIDVSPRGTKRETLEWIGGFIKGIIAGQQLSKSANVYRTIQLLNQSNVSNSWRSPLTGNILNLPNSASKG